MEELLSISPAAAFTFVSVFIAVLGFAYKIWGDVYQRKKQEMVEVDLTKVNELDSRVQMLEKQIKDIPRKFEELSKAMKTDDEKIHNKIDLKIDEIKEMIKDNKDTHAENYTRLESRIYELMRGYRGNDSSGN